VEFWKSAKYKLLEDIDCWNLCLANEKLGRTGVWQKDMLPDFLGKKQSSIEWRLFLIRQCADISDLFMDKSGARRWLERGILETVNSEDFFDLALYFEARLGSFDILGSTDDQQKSTLNNIRSMRENCCKTLGDTGNFMVVIEKKFYLLSEELMKN
jgi:hypothetical protein